MYSKREMKVIFLRYGVDLGKCISQRDYALAMETVNIKMESKIRANKLAESVAPIRENNSKSKSRKNKNNGGICYVSVNEYYEDNQSAEDKKYSTLKDEVEQISKKGYVVCGEEDVEVPQFLFEKLKFRYKSNADGYKISRPLNFFFEKEFFEELLDVNVDGCGVRCSGYNQNLGLVLLSAIDYVSLNSKVTVIKEMLNSFVSSNPASFRIWVSPSKAKRIFLTWVYHNIFFDLQAWNNEFDLNELQDRAIVLAEKINFSVRHI